MAPKPRKRIAAVRLTLKGVTPYQDPWGKAIFRDQESCLSSLMRNEIERLSVLPTFSPAFSRAARSWSVYFKSFTFSDSESAKKTREEGGSLPVKEMIFTFIVMTAVVGFISALPFIVDRDGSPIIDE